MKIKVISDNNFDISNKEDFLKFIPNEIHGEILNYGQGEGQIKLYNTIWGIYSDEDNCYCLVYEEGQAEWVTIKKIMDSIEHKLKSEISQEIELIIVGALRNEYCT